MISEILVEYMIFHLAEEGRKLSIMIEYSFKIH